MLKSSLVELTAAGSKASDALQFAKNFCEIIDDSEYHSEGGTASDNLILLLGNNVNDLFHLIIISSIQHYFYIRLFKRTSYYISDFIL